MTISDTKALFAPVDLPAAFGLLTRLPIRVNMDAAKDRGAASAWAYPLVGLFVGAMAALVGYALLLIEVPTTITAVIVIAVQVVLTGAMHEDGLADCADGFWGGWSVEHRLKIMKDSQIGTYGVLALVFCLLLRWLAVLTILSAAHHETALIAAAVISRSAMVSVMHIMPHARDNGLSQAVGRPRRATAFVSGLIAMLCCIALLGAATIGVVASVTITATICGVIAARKIKGQTGDVLGATQQLTEFAALLAIVVLAA